MEIVVPLVVGGLTGLSAAVACGAEPCVPRVPPAELARHALESVAEKLPRELVENDLLKKIARSWVSLIPVHRLGLVIEDDEARLAFLLLSSGACCVALAVISLSLIGFVLGLVAPFGVEPLAIPSTVGASSMMLRRPCPRHSRRYPCRLPRGIRWPRA